MNIRSQKEQFVLLFGDIFFFLLALWVTLLIRNLAWPSTQLFLNHLLPFSFIFAVWILVFFISDLYGKQTALYRKNLPAILFNTQVINSVIALAFFYFIPYFGITPKVLLFIDLVVSFVFVLIWRRFLAEKFYKARRENILFLCKGKEIDELIEEVKNNPIYNARVIDIDEVKDISKARITTVVINSYDKAVDDALADFYQMIFKGVSFVSAHNFYEEIFGRVPLGLITERWFIENISNRPKPFYDFFKRATDIFIAAIIGAISLIFYPFVWMMVKLDDRGPLFFSQARVGLNNKKFKIYKFRSLKDDANTPTKVGKFLRKTRIDELPQIWSVLKGEQSLIGPRPEMPAFVDIYQKDVSFYDIRHIIPPGLSGWAQIYHDNHPHHAPGVKATMEKLSYDLYYVKNRSILLDINICLKTLKTILLVKGK